MPDPFKEPDPSAGTMYANFSYRIWYEGRLVAGFNIAVGLGDDAGTGSLPSSSVPIVVATSPITLEAGVSSDQPWIEWVSALPLNLQATRKELVIEQYDQAQKVKSFQVFNCWASEADVLPDLDGSNGKAIQKLVLENEGFEVTLTSS